jgi:hypothetical protein
MLAAREGGEFPFEEAAFIASPVIDLAGPQDGSSGFDLVFSKVRPWRKRSVADRSTTVDGKNFRFSLSYNHGA